MSLLQTTSIKSPSFAVYDTPQSQPVPLTAVAATTTVLTSNTTTTTTRSSPYIHQSHHHHHYNQQQPPEQCHQQQQQTNADKSNQHPTASAPVSRWLPDSSTFHLASYMPTSKTRPVHLVAQNYCLQHKSYYAFSWCPSCGTLF
ncbi:hypothetical protein O0I10_006990 [Lichtheimia ornata]|uniref:Uncharacterized protein n=1 Tax=Lichtheimia ornata TaxID=688661 RepID=A0AAD7V2I4_9FUNG|nr:uncharacterized protein O0I10_006990 [Lichtheimia ornata]KAJ8657433.1 hypothetical protein O0I10_006990 [Lichtheimia ornata]